MNIPLVKGTKWEIETIALVRGTSTQCYCYGERGIENETRTNSFSQTTRGQPKESFADLTRFWDADGSKEEPK